MNRRSRFIISGHTQAESNAASSFRSLLCRGVCAFEVACRTDNFYKRTFNFQIIKRRGRPTFHRSQCRAGARGHARANLLRPNLILSRRPLFPSAPFFVVALPPLPIPRPQPKREKLEGELVLRGGGYCESRAWRCVCEGVGLRQE